MKVIWKQSLYRIIIWLAAEIILNCVGLDNLADFSEFVFERNTIDLFKNKQRWENKKVQFTSTNDGLELLQPTST